MLCAPTQTLYLVGRSKGVHGIGTPSPCSDARASRIVCLSRCPVCASEWQSTLTTSSVCWYRCCAVPVPTAAAASRACIPVSSTSEVGRALSPALEPQSRIQHRAVHSHVHSRCVAEIRCTNGIRHSSVAQSSVRMWRMDAEATTLSLYEPQRPLSPEGPYDRLQPYDSADSR